MVTGGKIALVTGANGFIGAHLCRELLDHGYQVRALHRVGSNLSALSGLNLELWPGDITERASLSRPLAGVEVVFHIAATFREAQIPDRRYFEVNLEGTRNVLESARAAGVRRFIHCSTTGVLGSIKSPPADESCEYGPCDVYQRSKTEAEQYVLAEFRSGRMDGCVVRPAMVWGPGDRRILKLFKGIAAGNMPLLGDGSNWTHWILVSDLARAFRLAAENPASAGQVYLIAGREPAKLIDIYRMIGEACGVRAPCRRIPIFPIWLASVLVEGVCVPFGIKPPLYRRRVEFFYKSRWFKVEKAQRELGFLPQHTLREEIALIAEWYERHGWMTRKSAADALENPQAAGRV